MTSIAKENMHIAQKISSLLNCDLDNIKTGSEQDSKLHAPRVLKPQFINDQKLLAIRGGGGSLPYGPHDVQQLINM